MLNFQPWKTWTVLVICLLGVIFALPNTVGPQTFDMLARYLPVKKMNLGLDLQGGSHLLLEVDIASVTRERLNADTDALRTQLIKAHIGYTKLDVEGQGIAIDLRPPATADQVQGLLHNVDNDLQLTTSPDNANHLTIAYSPAAVQARRQTILAQSIEIIRRRIDETGTKEPTIESVGSDRILVQLPGVGNPDHVKALIGKTAKLAFRMVDTSVSPEDAQHGQLPPGDELLPADPSDRRTGGPNFYVVQRRVMVDGGNLTDAQATFQDNQPVVAFQFDTIGANRFGQATGANIGRPMAIVLDNKVISAPVIQSQINGNGVITGNFSVQSAQDLALLLRAGALPAPLTIIEERTVGPDLGADSIRAGTTACIVAVTLVAVFMVLFYGLFGIFADIALFFNLCLMLAALSLLGATLTLPGIAGIALTLGMAVDANVLVNERIREELRNGRTVMSAIDNGFSKAYATIIDANATHLIAGLCLFELGSGSVKGFAVTLCFGIVTSLFTTIMVSRLLVVAWLRRTRPKTVPL
ncbi:MAG TPA: protein translocase subunit SecD [Stellaceae bacterium]|jgi:protein-export membrane protein SecD|nr:protein translocase subunit SecD [Stellaceae bacterium]